MSEATKINVRVVCPVCEEIEMEDGDECGACNGFKWVTATLADGEAMRLYRGLASRPAPVLPEGWTEFEGSVRGPQPLRLIVGLYPKDLSLVPSIIVTADDEDAEYRPAEDGESLDPVVPLAVIDYLRSKGATDG